MPSSSSLALLTLIESALPDAPGARLGEILRAVNAAVGTTRKPYSSDVIQAALRLSVSSGRATYTAGSNYRLYMRATKDTPPPRSHRVSMDTYRAQFRVPDDDPLLEALRKAHPSA